MRVAILMYLVGCVSCMEGQEFSEIQPLKSTQRYQVLAVEPPMVFHGVMALKGNDGNWPYIMMQTVNDTYYTDINASYSSDDGITNDRTKLMGLGLSLKFYTDLKDNQDLRLEKSSVTLRVEGNRLFEDRYYGVYEKEVTTVKMLDGNCLECHFTVNEGLKCRINCYLNEPGEFKTVWHDRENPIVELTHLLHDGIYAMTKSGQLLHINRYRDQKGLQPKRLHNDITFVRNTQGRYFINAPSNLTCMKTKERDIYCAEKSALANGSKIYGLTSQTQPLLAKVDQPSFDVEEVAFGGRHYCFLAANGDVWCKGDNSCGQITGRHDKKQFIEKLERVEILDNKAKQLFAHASGTCALLIDGRVQCFGLGASVKRTRILDDEAYRSSFSWVEGFRPWRVCEGGAEYGL